MTANCCKTAAFVGDSKILRILDMQKHIVSQMLFTIFHPIVKHWSSLYYLCSDYQLMMSLGSWQTCSPAKGLFYLKYHLSKLEKNSFLHWVFLALLLKLPVHKSLAAREKKNDKINCPQTVEDLEIRGVFFQRGFQLKPLQSPVSVTDKSARYNISVGAENHK